MVWLLRVCKDIGIAEKIDTRIGKQDPRRIVSPGMRSWR